MHIKINKGLDLPIEGAPSDTVHPFIDPDIISIDPRQFKTVKPKLSIQEGDSVRIGDCIFYDKNKNDVKFVSTVSGSISSIEYGERRVITNIIIKNDRKYEYTDFAKISSDSIDRLSSNDAINELCSRGLWPLIRQRPFDIIPDTKSNPKSIFVNYCSSSPLSSNKNLLFNNSGSFYAGLQILGCLSEKKVHLVCDDSTYASELSTPEWVKKHLFTGPHPSGNTGIHIHHIDPIDSPDSPVFYISAEDVHAIGQSILSGKFYNKKIIAVGGNIDDPSHIEILRSTVINDVVGRFKIKSDSIFISGNVLSGNALDINSGHGFYDSSISILAKSLDRPFLGWLKPGFSTFSFSRSFASYFFNRNKKYTFNNKRYGSHRTIIPFGYWEDVLPIDVLPTYLVKSILANDIDEMENLGIYECSPEDFALCSYVCQSKVDVSHIIEQGLDYMMENA